MPINTHALLLCRGAAHLHKAFELGVELPPLRPVAGQLGELVPAQYAYMTSCFSPGLSAQERIVT